MAWCSAARLVEMCSGLHRRAGLLELCRHDLQNKIIIRRYSGMSNVDFIEHALAMMADCLI